mgnify:FL=1|tara:strand:- start:2013 stop:2255 length:243 start_codon:yes stop_codon:yes gene_type:complete
MRKNKIIKIVNVRQVVVFMEGHGLFLVSESHSGDETLVFPSNLKGEMVKNREVDGAKYAKLCEFLNDLLFSEDWEPVTWD